MNDDENMLDSEAKAFLLKVAREAMEHAVHTGKAFEKGHFLASAPQSTLENRGAFVIVKDRATGKLHGCMGEVQPTRPLVEAVAAQAVEAALNDLRFAPVTEGNLPNVAVEISVLSPLKPVESWKDIVVGRDGITIEKDGSFAVCLPQIPQYRGWDLTETLTSISRSAGLPPDAWREGAKLETFQAEVFHE